MMKTLSIVMMAWMAAPGAAWAQAAPGESASSMDGTKPEIRVGDGQYQLAVPGGAAIRLTSSPISQLRVVAVPQSATTLVLWQEAEPDGPRPYYTISRDGHDYTRARAATYDIRLQHGDFAPAGNTGEVEDVLSAPPESSLYVVQFVVQPLEEFRQQIQALGGTVYNFLADHAHIVKMAPEVRRQVAALPYVRWIGPYHPAYRLEATLREGLSGRKDAPARQRYRIQLLESGAGQKNAVADRISALGGVIDDASPEGFILQATLTAEQLLAVAQMDEVLYVDRWGPPVAMMNLARSIGGANYVESAGGFTGQGVRAEVMDDGCQTTHPALASRIAVRRGPASVESHGTSTFGINFGDGTGNSSGRGMLPSGNGVFSMWGPPNRYADTAELITDTWHCVYQSNSWHTSGADTVYGTVASELDHIVFDYDIVILQAQGNYGGTSSAPEAWAKNVVSVGGIVHNNTLTKSDDGWFGQASTGPAADGRVKPDLAHFYDSILTTTTGSGYTSGFGGTSGATPIVAGHFGIFFQMWAAGIFGNPVSGGSVFEERPHSSTARAMLINTASSYSFSGTGADLTRTHQGWGLPDLQYLYDRRNNIFVVDEDDVLLEFQGATYGRTITTGATYHDKLRVTLVYTDRPGTTSSSLHRINDLSLKVTSPTGTTYYGNNGLLAGNVSTSGGSSDTINPVENVFINSPSAGTWKVEVLADDINEDGHTETPELDADYALVISGGADCPRATFTAQPTDQYACLGEPVTLNAGVSGFTSVQWYKGWQAIPDATSSGLTIDDFSAADAGTYRLLATNACGTRWSDPAEIIDAGGPSIGGQPVPALTRCVGASASFSVSAAGLGGLSYQWYRNGQLIPDATASVLVLNDLHRADAGNYTCSVSNLCSAVLSDVGILTVAGAEFTRHPRNRCGEVGATVVLSAEAPADAPVYWGWKKNGSFVSGANTNTLTLANLQPADAASYRAVAATYSPITCIRESNAGVVTVGNCPCVPGDMDGDGDFDLADMAIFAKCFGPGGALLAGCACANIDGDAAGNVDLTDWAAAESLISGPLP